jgi:cell division protease FtsH
VKSVRIGPDEIDGELFVHPASAKAASSEAASSKAGKPTPQTAAKEMPAAGKTAPPEAPPPAPKAKTAAAPKPEPAAPPATAPPAQPAAPPPSASAPSSAPAPAPSAPATGKPAAAPASPATSVAEKASGAPKEETRAFRTVRVEDPNLLADLERAGIDYTGERPSMWPQLLLSWLLPIGIIALLWFVVFRRIGAAGAGQAALSFGKSRARLIADREVGVTFADVAGCDEAKQELSEVVEFLRRPEHFTALGAKIPKGVLLVGPPGTGKTLLARAAAGEARVPFFSLSGSDFVEMFVGVGAARVRDLFQEAKRAAPCIVFVDELDAIGRARGVHLSNINDEREHTLNQLLVEMDGFEPNSGIVILAATNRPDVLDPALLRPGRFDRQVVLDAPDRAGREAILRVHARGKKLASDVDLGAVARATPGFSGADLANALNEAALLAARRNLEHIGMPEIEEAVEKVVAGPERKSRRLDPQEKRRVAVHEVGHALVAMRSRWADPVHKISIVPRGRAALGYTLQLPTGDRHLLPAAALYDRLRGLLGGRAAEEVVFGDVSTGAENDLEMATAIARRMVCQFGMGKSVGLLHCARDASRLAFLPESGATERDCSEATAHSIDEEVRAMLDEAYGVARDLIVHNREALERAADALIEHETLDHAALRELLGAPPGEA